MPGRFQYRPDRSSGPLLATTLVLFLGALGATVVVTASGQSPYIGLLIFAGFAAIVPVILLLTRATPQRTLTSLYSWIKSRDDRPEDEYKPRAARATKEYGTNRPPSAADVKDMKGSPSNWVPSKTPPPGKRKK